MGAVFERSERLYDAIYAWKDYSAEVERLDAVIRERLPDARTVLDVACGTGKHLELLIGRGYEVAGVDLDPEMLALARERLGPDVPLHVGDMVGLDLGQTFDVVTCLFSSIAYARTEERLRAAVASLARHAGRAGLVLVEPFFARDTFEPGRPWSVFVDEPDLKVARMDVSEVRDGVAVLNFHYLVATPDGVEYFTERHEVGLFTVEQHIEAFRVARLDVNLDAEGLMGRGLYVGVKGG
jgi:SAM-dependent methyltransferase